VPSDASELLALLGYLAISILMTLPLMFSLATHIPGDCDAFWYLWLFWWFEHSIFKRCASPYFTDFIFYPNGTNLSLSINSIFNTILSIPLRVAFGPIPAYNLLILLSFVMTAWSTYSLAKYVTGSRLGSFVAGLIFAFSRYRFDAMASGLNGIVTTQWIPFFVLYFLRTLREESKVNRVLASIFFALICLSDWYYAVFAAFYALALLAYFLATKHSGDFLSAISSKLATISIISIVLILPVLYPILAESLFGSYESLPRDVYVPFSADPIGFLVPNPQAFTGQTQNIVKLFPGLWHLLQEFYKNVLNRDWIEGDTYLGYSLLTLATYAILKLKKRVRLWAACAVLFAILSLGPYLRTLGTTEFTSMKIRIPLPFLLLVDIPILKSVIHPGRFIMLTILSMAILAAFGVKDLLGKTSTRKLSKGQNLRALWFGLICLAVLSENLSIPIFMSRGTILPVYYPIAAEPGDFAILEVPLGSNYDTAGFYDRYQYYQTLHQKRIFGGYIARFPKSTQWFIDGTPVFRHLRYLHAQEDILTQDISMIGSTVLQYYNVRYVLVHKDLFMWHQDYNRPDTLQRILPLLEFIGLDLFFEDELVSGFRTPEKHEKQVFMRLGESWHVRESWEGVPTRWMENNATLCIVNPTASDLRVDIELRAFGAFRARRLHVLVRETLVGSFQLPIFPAGKDCAFTLTIPPGETTVKFHCPEGTDIPSRVGAWNSDKHISVAFQNIRIVGKTNGLTEISIS